MAIRASDSASIPCQVKPFFIWRLTAPPSALSPKTGLLDQMSARSTATSVGIRSQLTVSPNASLSADPVHVDGNALMRSACAERRTPTHVTHTAPRMPAAFYGATPA